MPPEGENTLLTGAEPKPADDAKPGEGAGEAKLGEGAGEAKPGEGAGEVKPGEGAGEAKPGEGAGEVKPGEGAPAEYTNFTLPDGVEVDKATMEAFKPLAKKFNLTQAQAQELVDVQANALTKAGEGQVEAWGKVVDDWLAETKADETIGGDNLSESLSLAKKALNALDASEKVMYTDESGRKRETTKLHQLLDTTGMGSHVELIRLLTRVGRAIGEDNLSFGRPASGSANAADIMFAGETA